MWVEQQGYFECMLATIAALANVSLTEVRETACTRAKVDCWEKVCYSYILFWDTIRYLKRYYHVSGVPGTNRYNTIPGNAQTLVGKGSISIRPINFLNTHIMPFENGLIYDPNQSRSPFPLEDLEKRYPKWEVVKIMKSRKKPFDKLKAIL